MNKRTFIKSLAVAGFSSIQVAEALAAGHNTLSSAEIAKEEDFWESIRRGYKLKPEYINLENGYYCFLPEETLENFIRHVREVNYQASYFMRNHRDDNKKLMVEKLAALAGCSPNEIGITRNTTESLDTVISGFDWRSGDEAVMAEQDYFSMLTMFKASGEATRCG